MADDIGDMAADDWEWPAEVQRSPYYVPNRVETKEPPAPDPQPKLIKRGAPSVAGLTLNPGEQTGAREITTSSVALPRIHPLRIPYVPFGVCHRPSFPPPVGAHQINPFTAGARLRHPHT